MACHQSSRTHRDETKPPLPYVPGQMLTVRPHEPPELTRPRFLKKEDLMKTRSKSPLERCLLYPPSEGLTGASAISLRIIEGVRVGDGHHSQVVAVEASSNNEIPSGIRLIAKFYDPLYYGHRGYYNTFTDYNYSHETAAYKTLCELYGTIIPRYYGSYTCELTTLYGNGFVQRPVRLILIEAVNGASMRDLNVEQFSQTERQTIMRMVIEAETNIHMRNVMHRDLYPRNVLVERLQDSLRVVIIDFGSAVSRVPHCHGSACTHGATLEEEKIFLPGVRISPFLRWNEALWPYLPGNFEEWIDWDWQPWLEHYWPEDDTITEHMREIWLPRDLIMPPPSP